MQSHCAEASVFCVCNNAYDSDFNKGSCVSVLPVVSLNVWIHQPAVTKLSLSSPTYTRRCRPLWLQAVLVSPTASLAC